MKKMLFGMVLLSLLFVSCSNDDDAVPSETNGTLNLSFQGLEDLGPNFAYEGWIMVEGTPVSTGRFSVNTNGSMSQSAFEVPSSMLSAATKFILTIEPQPDADPLPSDQKLIAGDFEGSSASISTSVAPAVGDFSNVFGDFFLRSPTDEPVGSDNNGNDQYGVWFGLPGMPPSASLNLPNLPQGWVYEGWVIGESGPLSTGKFLSVDEMDDNAGAAGSYGGTEQLGPPLPGEDFFNNAPNGEVFPLDLRQRQVVISVEPIPDNSPAPFLLKPLAGTAGMETAPTSYMFSPNTSAFPTGMATR